MSTVQFDTGVTEFVAKLRTFIRARVPDDATADDLTQETLLKVYRSRASLRDGDRLESWLYRTARRTLIDYYRKRRPREDLPASLKSESEDEVSSIRDAVLISTIRYMEELPDAYRAPLQLCELEGMTMSQIAIRLALSLTAVISNSISTGRSSIGSVAIRDVATRRAEKSASFRSLGRLLKQSAHALHPMPKSKLQTHRIRRRQFIALGAAGLGALTLRPAAARVLGDPRTAVRRAIAV